MDGSLPLKSIDMNITTDKCSSDTSSDDCVPVKKTRSKTIRRGLCCKKSSAETRTVPQPVPEVPLYSARVRKCLQDCKAGKIHIDLEDDAEEIIHEEKVVLYNSSSESTDEDLQLIQENSNIFISSSQSPSPPPPPKIVPEKKRTRKMKTAIKKLDAARNMLKGSVVEDDDDDVVVVLEESPLQEKQNIVVMVRYKETVHRFPMKRWDPFCYTKAKLAEILHVPENQVVLLLKDKTVSSSDTPASVNMHIADIIDCHVYASKRVEPEVDSAESLDPDTVSLCVQCLSSKSKVTVSTNKYQPLRTLMVRFAVMKKIELSYLRFQFDGEDLLPADTPASLDMEDGDCIDAIEL